MSLALAIMPALKKYNPDSIVKPFASYCQGVEVPPNARWLYITGQVGANPDGTVAGDSEKQVERAWQNVLAVLTAANMGPEDLVHVNVYITDPADVQLNRESWRKISRNGGPGVTMVTVKRLSHPDWKVEISAVAARA
ncbi:MAG TPA: RidA family protein [Casimicrobiaceae bacterium]|nr:RidA family protein [Casimicrobiaceae bacterium]